MWIASILQVLALGAADPAAPLAAFSAPAPIYSRQTLFSIPFHVERSNQPAQEPVQVQLYVSPDRGVRWDNWRQAPPEKGYFLFKAGVDAEYWFDVRTLDRSGKLRPEGPHTPKLIVIVDTVAPTIQLAAVRGDAGQITAAFRIKELYPKLDSLVIEYRLASTSAWQAVPVGPKDIHSNNAEHTGQVTWYPQNAAGNMEIRLRISDMAGNPAESHTHIMLPTATGAAATVNPVRPLFGDLTTTKSDTNPLGPWSPTLPGTPAVAASSAVTSASSPGATSQPGRAWQPLGPPTGATAWPAESAGPASIVLTKPETPPRDASGGSIDIRVNPPATNQLVANQTPVAPATSATNPFEAFTISHRAEPATAAANDGNGVPPPGAKVRWINMRVFQLDYDTRIMGGAGSEAVELWGTQDGGKSWQSFGKDPKGQSPMLVTVPGEGVYGFRMAIQSANGMAGRPPLPGDVPNYWVGVDLTRPVGRITSAQQGAGPDGGKLFIAWEARDNHELAAKPISLSYSERQGGPWTSMATGLENTGRYAWQLSGSLPQRMYLRLEIHDAAGNIGVYETPQPVPLDLSSPAAQLRDLRPVGRLDAPASEQPRQW